MLYCIVSLIFPSTNIPFSSPTSEPLSSMTYVLSFSPASISQYFPMSSSTSLQSSSLAAYLIINIVVVSIIVLLLSIVLVIITVYLIKKKKSKQRN